jgi:hypothetical protein
MAAYATTTTLDYPKVKKLGAAGGLAFISGIVNITNYNQTTLAEITAITGKFRTGAINVVCSGVSDGAVKQLVRWDATSKSFRCYVPTTGAETATDVNVGSVHFHAFGVAP